MVGKRRAALFAAMASLSLHAQAAEPAKPGDAPFVVVGGLAIDDMLNVRATASATGMVIGRLDNGSKLKNLGCSEVNGHDWCNIAAVDDGSLHGWAPARYLHADPAGSPEAPPAGPGAEAQEFPEAPPIAVAAATPSDGAPESDNTLVPPLQDAVTVAAVPAPVAAPAPSAKGERADWSARQVAPVSPEATETRSLAPELPSNLGARLGGPPPNAPGFEPEPAPVENDVIAAAFDQAFAVQGVPVRGDIYTPSLGGGQSVPEPTPAPIPTPDSTLDLAPVIASAAVRPQIEAVSRQPTGPRTAQLQAAAPSPADSLGEVPCARYIGQPMMRCEAAVARTGADAAEVTVTLPDGGRRVIRFRDGKPEGSNSRGEFRFTREGDLSMIRIGTSERFEIPDALAFGD